MKATLKKLAQNKKHQKRARYVLSALVVVLLLVQAAVVISLQQNISVLRLQASGANGQNFRELALRAAELLYTDAVVEPKEQMIYIPELRIRMPLNPELRKVVYSFHPSSQGQPESADITFDGAYAVMLNSDSSLQKIGCGRIIEVSNHYVAPTDDRDVKELPLGDGRTLYLNIIDKDKCDSFVPSQQVDQLIGIVSQAEAY
jgi:hypothetical protein